MQATVCRDTYKSLVILTQVHAWVQVTYYARIAFQTVLGGGFTPGSAQALQQQEDGERYQKEQPARASTPHCGHNELNDATAPKVDGLAGQWA